MRNDPIDTATRVPVLPEAAGRFGHSSDPFAFARRLKTAAWIFDIDNTCILYANASACQLWQAESEEELKARDLASDMSQTVAKRLKQYQTDFLERDATFNEMWTLYPNGQPTSVMVFFSGFRLPDGRMAMLCETQGIANDTPDNLRSIEALMHTDVMVPLFKMDGAPLYMNPPARRMSIDATQSFEDLFVKKEVFQDLVFEVGQSGEHRQVAKMKTSEGERWHDLSVRRCLDAVTGAAALLVTATDVTDLKEARDQARYLAARDLLTGCYNRSHLQRRFEVLSKSTNLKCAIAYFDIDRFKTINDQFGHATGDAVLKEVAHRVKAVVGPSDLVARLGGDEFVVLFEDVDFYKEYPKKIRDLFEAIAEPIKIEQRRINMSFSMGVAQFESANSEFTDVLREADQALYAAKNDGRGCWRFFTSKLGEAANQRRTLEMELNTAIEDESFVLHFQPRIDIDTGKVVSAEGLVRWLHPERGLIAPGNFIPICEETGMIEDLGRLVIAQGCQQAIDWHKNGLDIDLSVNVSPRQFEDDRLLEDLQKFAQHEDFPRNKIELELTESVLIGDHIDIEGKLADITAMGYRIAIDDFGTGYSNLSYITRFPLHCLKIDRSFVSQLPNSGPIVRLILSLARQIGTKVVAEGVETREQLDWLAGQDCDQAQGFYHLKPVELPLFMDYLSATNSA